MCRALRGFWNPQSEGSRELRVPSLRRQLGKAGRIDQISGSPPGEPRAEAGEVGDSGAAEEGKDKYFQIYNMWKTVSLMAI